MGAHTAMTFHREPRRDAYDVVVVGSGIGGLVAASLLAKAGLTVLVAEAQPAPGGYIHAFQRGQYTLDPSVHLVVDPLMFDRLLRHLGVRDRIRFIEPETFYTVMMPGFKLHVPFGKDAYVETLAASVPGHGAEIRRFLEICAQIQREAHELPARVGLNELDVMAAQLPILFKYRKANLAEVLDEYLTDPKARGLCGAPAAYLGIPPSMLSFQTFAQMIFSHVTNGASYVAGGLQQLADALVVGLEQHGSELICGNRVTGIRVEAGKATGVSLQNGEYVRAPTVVSNADPIQTYDQLVGAGHLSVPFVRTYRRLQPSVSGFLVFMATNMDMRQFDPGHLVFHYKSWDLEECFRKTRQGRVENMFEYLPTTVDPSLAPPGEHLLTSGTTVPYDIGRPWSEAKAEYQEMIVNEADTLYPGLRDHLTFVETATPMALERFTLNHRGAIYGWENTPQQTGSKRPNHVTPVDGLFLAGGWTAPGGGFVRSVVSGMVSAQLVLNRAGNAAEIPRFMS